MSDNIKITSGIYCGRNIKVPKLYGLVRPTKIIIRKVLFDIIMQYLPEKFTFMDICAGYGIVGMEALSRGASLVVFCEINRKCIESIKDNIKLMTKIEADIIYYNKSALKITKGRVMNAIFIDPPYASYKIIYDIIYRLYNNEWIDNNTLIVFETDSDIIFESNEKIEILRTKTIGKTTLYFARYINYIITENINNNV